MMPFTEAKKVQRMIRKDGEKLLVYPKAKKVRLYHVDKDPNELMT